MTCAGIIDTSGQLWRDQRKTSLRILRALGMGQNLLAQRVQMEVHRFCDVITKQALSATKDDERGTEGNLVLV
jgi:hypothetical protein